MAESERDFQAAVIALAKTCGWRVAHFRPAMMRSGKWATPMSGDAGYVDLTLAGHGRILFWELKVGRNKLSAAQESWRDALEDAGGEWALMTPADWPEIQALLGGRGRLSATA